MGIFMKPTDPPFSDYEHEIGKSSGAHAAIILWKVRLDLGILLHEVHTGGGCYALEGRLESGHWIVATDPDCHSLRSRLGLEWFGKPMGWCVGIYNDHEDGWANSEENIVQAFCESSEGWQLSEVMHIALRNFLDCRRDLSSTPTIRQS